MQGSSGDADIENILVDKMGKEKLGQIERVVLKHVYLPYIKQKACENLLYDTGNSNLVLCDNLGRWDGVGILNK